MTTNEHVIHLTSYSQKKIRNEYDSKLFHIMLHMIIYYDNNKIYNREGMKKCSSCSPDGVVCHISAKTTLTSFLKGTHLSSSSSSSVHIHTTRTGLTALFACGCPLPYSWTSSFFPEVRLDEWPNSDL